MVPGGSTKLSGWCMPAEGGDGASVEFYYPTVWVTVTTPYRLDVEPSTTVKAASTLGISSVGGGCEYAFQYPQVNLYSESNAQLAQGTIHPGVTTSGWTSSLLVPSGLKPGYYRLEADCVVGPRRCLRHVCAGRDRRPVTGDDAESRPWATPRLVANTLSSRVVRSSSSCSYSCSVIRCRCT